MTYLLQPQLDKFTFEVMFLAMKNDVLGLSLATTANCFYLTYTKVLTHLLSSSNILHRHAVLFHKH